MRSGLRNYTEEYGEEQRLLVNDTLAGDEGDFSESEFSTPLGGLPPLTGHEGHQNQSSLPAVLSASRKSIKAIPKIKKFKESVWSFVSVLTYLFCLYVFVVVFVTAISFSINFLSQIIFTCFTTRNFSYTAYPVVIFALVVFGLYAVTAFPIFIYDIFALVADSVPRKAQYREFASRILYTNFPQRMLSRWYSDEAALMKPAPEVDRRRHILVRGFIIVPAIIAAIPLAAIAGDVSLLPAWFLCISFLAALALAVIWVVLGYIKMVVEHCDFYRWIRMQWNAHSESNSEVVSSSTGHRVAIRIGLILAAFLTPLSFHWVIWKYQIRGHKLVTKDDETEDEVEILGFRTRKRPGSFRKCFRMTKRVMWTLTWLFLPFSVFSTVVMFSLISVRAGISAMIFFLVTFPAVAIAFKHIWKGKASVWPLIVYVILLGLTLLGFGFLLGTLTSQNQEAHISPTNPALRSLFQRPPSEAQYHPSAPNSGASTWANYQTDGIPHPLGRRQSPKTPQGVMSYQMCKAEWNNLDIIDFGLLSWLSYFETNSTDFWQYANHWFGGSDWQLVHFTDNPVHFFDFYSPSRNLSVVSVRGTASVVDGLEDLDLWSEALQLELVSMVFPFVFTWPDSSTAVLVEAMSYLERIFVPTGVDFTYFYTVHNYVIDIKSKRNVLLTGHSLGGSVAQVVGAKESIPAITYCAPGIVYSRRKFGVEFDAIQKWTVTIRTTSDLISAIDSPGGVVQDVRCDSSTAFPNCHFLSHLLCPLLRSGCGHHTTDLPSPIICD